MTAAIIGFLGVVIGLAVGSGFRFWTTRRSELAEAVIAAATLRDELRHAGEDDRPALTTSWRENRRWLVIHMRPDDYRLLADAFENLDGEQAPLAAALAVQMDSLHELFWKEHEAFILIPLVRWAQSETLSKRIHELLRSSRASSPAPPPPPQPAAPE